MTQKTKKTLIYIFLSLILLFVIVVVISRINKDGEQPFVEQGNKQKKTEGQVVDIDEEQPREKVQITKEEEEDILELLDYNVAQFLAIDGYSKDDLVLIDILMVNEGEALIKYRYKEEDLGVEVDFRYDNDLGLSLNDYRILNNTTAGLVSPEEG